MPIVSEIVDHILHHVDAEDTLIPDPSQVPGVRGRATYARQFFNSFLGDTRDLDQYVFLNEASGVAPPNPRRGSMRGMLAAAEAINDPRPRLIIQEWVGKATENRRDG